MKKSEKLSIVAGISLLVVAALFLVALLIQLLPFGSKGSVPVLGSLGSLLFGAYGYSSLLIPCFFFAAGLGCILFPWNERIGVIYGLSFVPFFTIVITEKICAGMLSLGNSPLVGIQVAAAIIVCILLLGIEYFAASFVGGLVQNKLNATSQPVEEPPAVQHPPIFPEGMLRDDVVELSESQGGELASENPPVQEEVPQEVFEEEPQLEEEQEVSLEETMVMDSIGEEAVLPGNHPAVAVPLEEDAFPEPVFSEPVAQTCQPMAAPIDLGDVASPQTQPGIIQQSRMEAEVAAWLAAQREAASAETSQDESEQQQEEKEDVFGKDFFETAPIPTEDVFSKEYIASLHAQREAARQEMVQPEETKQETASIEAAETAVPASEPVQTALPPDEEPQPMQFQPIPHYSMNPQAVMDSVDHAQLHFTADDFANPQEAAFLEDPFGEGYRLEEDAVVTQAQFLDDGEAVSEQVADEGQGCDDNLADDSFAEDDSFDPEEDLLEDDPYAKEEQFFDDQESGSEELALQENRALQQELLPDISFPPEDQLESDNPDLDGNFFVEDDSFDPEDDLETGTEGESVDVEDDDIDEAEAEPAFDEEEGFDLDFPPEDDETAEEDMEEDEILTEESDTDEELMQEAERTPFQVEPLVERAVPHRSRGPYTVPAAELLQAYPGDEYWVIDDETLAASEELKDTLGEFKIEAEVTGIRKGPVITMFEILPAPGVKLSKIVALQDNIALRLAASSVRIVAPIPGKHAVGIEVPNKERAIVSFKELIDTDNPAFRKQAVPVVLGKDITGEAQIIDLAKTPHLLIAGSTGSGKSVCVNSLILSILFKRSPQEVRMILIDPKIVELKLYNDIPHLLTPVITEPKKAFQALQYCLCEMERRYALLDGMGVREITSYNKRIVERNIATEKLPYIVVIIDEFADLMATTGKELESTVARLAAMSRAVGIHLVLATQRPSIDVITGLIKANIPSRIAFMVASKMDSRIIIDQVGAEKLLGKGDMLYASATDPFPIRIQGTFVSDNEVENVVEFVKQYGEPDYIDDEIFVDEEETDMGPGLFGEGEDPLYDQALEIVMQAGKASASYIQRRLKIGYNRAARLVEEMENKGIVGPANGSKPREIIQMP